MDNSDKEMDNKLKLLRFTKSKTPDSLKKRNAVAIERQCEALRSITVSIEALKLTLMEAKFNNGDDEDAITRWSKEIENSIDEVDSDIASLKQCLDDMKSEETLNQQGTENALKKKAREEQLAFEREQYEQKLHFEQKLDETNKERNTGKSTGTSRTKLPKLEITKFNGEHTDWLRFWGVFEAEVDGQSDVAAVTKFAYLKELLQPKVRAGIDGLPFTTEGYTRAKHILKTKYGKPSEIVNAYVQNIMALPVITGTQPSKIHDFYERLLFNVQALETMGKLKEVNGYVRMSVDKLEGIRGDLVRTDDDWQEWDFPKFVDALRKWTERNPIRIKSKEKANESPPSNQRKRWEAKNTTSYRTQQQHQGEIRSQKCVYCVSEEHKSVECDKVIDVVERRRILQQKRLCFNCAKPGHRAAECRSRLNCRACDAKHHTSICDKEVPVSTIKTAKQGSDQQVVYPVVVVDVHGIKCRALLDSGAGSSYASAALLKRIGARPQSSGMRRIEMMLGATTRKMETYHIKISSLKGDFAMDVNVTKIEKPQLMTMKNPHYKRLIDENPHLKGVVMEYKDERQELPVHLVLGNSECPRISTSEPARIGNDEWSPVANLTKLGWTITSPGQEFDITALLLTQTANADYEELCKLDVLGLADLAIGDQNEVYEEFKEQLERSEEGWYKTGLPWKGNHPPLPKGREASLRRLSNLVRKLDKSKVINEYHEIIKEQLSQGVVEHAQETVVGRECYIPHKAVVREKAESTKLRIVYDASSKVRDGVPSLNECLNPGPPLQNQLWSVLIRGRFHPVAITGDIKKAFLQVRVREEDRDALRFHWLKNLKTREVETLRFTRALFGLAPSPFLLGGVINQHLESWQHKRPKAVHEIKKSLYVDDLISGAVTTTEAKQLKNDATEIFADAAFELHKWHSNDPTLESNQNNVDEQDQTFAKQQLGEPMGEDCGLLGLTWNKREDTVSVIVAREIVPTTKRGILTKLAKIYDPLGVASPLTLRGKMLYRDACNLKRGWDQQLPADLLERWKRWEGELPTHITTRRSLVKYKEPINSIDLHVFGDASGKGVAAAAYTVVSQPSGTTQGLVTAKSRLAKQGLTIPRQELVSGHMAANLATNITDALQGFPIKNTYCWLDSTVALHWIKGGGNYKQFVQNRVNKIQEKKGIKWRHVPTNENPADLGSRGGAVSQDNELWWTGPEWLAETERWPTDISTTATKESLAEAKKVRELFKAATEEQPDKFSELLTRRRSYWKVLRVCAYVARFLRNARVRRLERDYGPITTEELEIQRLFWERRVQQEGTRGEHYEEDRMQLNLQKNGNGLFECRGRIQGHYPIYLPDTSTYTEKFVQQAHEDTLHGGVGLTITKVREKYWVPRLRRLAKRLIKSCPGCKRFQAIALSSPPPGLLPRDRTEGRTPFQVVGVDYAGPIKIRTSRKREAKAYVVLYSCSLTRALHLHLVRSMEMSEFLLSLKEFIARRGKPETIYSDNGRTFVGAAAWMKQVKKEERLNAVLVHHGIAWKFNLSRAPWWGGQFERMVGLVKGALRKSIGHNQLFFHELKEVLLDVEIALNNRPLSYVEDDVQMPILTPTSFLYPQSNTLPEMAPHCEGDASLRKRAKYLLKCKDDMWQRWTKEYLRGLRERHKLKHKGSPPATKKGDVVIIKGDEKDRNKWKLGVVETPIRGKDGIVRAVRLRAGRNHLERAIQHLYPLELSCDREKETPTDTLNPEAPEFRPRRDAATAARIRIEGIAEEENN